MMQATIEQAIAAFNSGDFPRAQGLSEEILLLSPDEPWALLILARVRIRAQDTPGALQLLHRAGSIPSGDHSFFFNLGSAFNGLGYPDEARRAFETALAIDPEFPMALAGLGNVLLQLGDFAGARRALERAVTLKPHIPQALASLADLALKEHAPEVAERHAKGALAAAPGHGAALLVLAQIEIARKLPKEALELIDGALAKGDLGGSQRGLALGLRGEALDLQDRFDEAFQAYSEANDLQRKAFAAQFDRDDLAASPAMIRRLMEFTRRSDPARWPKLKEDRGPPPVFLVGFPRSGTTLMGQILGAHPGAATLEEGERLLDATSALVLAPGALDRWSECSPMDLARLRSAYWTRARANIEANGGRVVIDKMPMNLALLPVIHLLFPKAKIILALRDPRDTVLSCFQQRFQMNPATYQLLSLERAAAYYDAVMALGAAARTSLPLDVHELRYEAIVRDFDRTIGEALGFLGLAWDDAVRSYASAARSALIRTPSASKVAQPIYATASQRWRNYAHQIEPVRPLLEPWVLRFGYEPWGEPDP